MRDQEAGENNYGGLATQALLRYIKGEICIDTRRPYLDLVHIGRIVSSDLTCGNNKQTPVVWGLSLTGISTFTKNPYFNSEPPSNTINMPTFISSDLALVKEEKEKIWFEYLRISQTGYTPALVHTLVRSVNDLKTKDMDPAKIGSFLLGTAEGLAMRVSERADFFSEVEILASCGAAFLPILEELDVSQSFLSLIDRVLQRSFVAFDKLVRDLEDPNALLSKRSELSDLYFLPIRISKILGWLALIQKIQLELGLDERIIDKLVVEALEKISKQFGPSFVCVSNEQSPYLMLYTQMRDFLDKNETFLIPLKSYFKDFIKRNGVIATSFISGEDVLVYLLCRSSNYYADCGDILENPSELLSVILNAAGDVGMDDEIDPYMKYIDHLTFNIFLPEDISVYSEERILNGVNVTMQVGSETGSGVFTVDDFRRNFAQFCNPKIEALRNDKKKETLIATAFASFMLPDRVPWHLKEKMGTY